MGRRNKLDPSTRASLVLGVLVILLSFIVGGIIAYRNTRTLSDNAALVTHTHEVLISLADVFSLTKDAERGQRGFVITGDDRYLAPYNLAAEEIEKRIDGIKLLVQDNPEQLDHLPSLRQLIDSKLRELAETIALRRTQGFDAARSVIETDRGRELMEQIRVKIGEMQRIERALRAERLSEMMRAYRISVTSGVITSLIGVGLAGLIGYLLTQMMLRRSRQDWLQNGQIALSKAMSGDQSHEQLGDNILRFFAEYLTAQAGAFFVRDGDAFRRVAAYGVPAENGTPERIALNDGLVGQAVRDQRPFFVRDLPDGYLTFGSSMGRAKPKHLAIVPVLQEGRTSAVMELGFAESPDEEVTALFERVGVGDQFGEVELNGLGVAVCDDGGLGLDGDFVASEIDIFGVCHDVWHQ